LIGVPFLIAFARVYLHARNFGIPKPTITLPVAGIGSMLVGMVRTLVARHRSWFAYLAGAVVGPLGLGALFLAFTSGAALRGIRHDWPLELFAIGAFILFFLFADLTAWSPHPFYKRALWGSFGLERKEGPN